MENLENNMKENINDKKTENVPVTPKKKKKKFFRWLKRTLGSYGIYGRDFKRGS